MSLVSPPSPSLACFSSPSRSWAVGSANSEARGLRPEHAPLGNARLVVIKLSRSWTEDPTHNRAPWEASMVDRVTRYLLEVYDSDEALDFAIRAAVDSRAKGQPAMVVEWERVIETL